MKHSLLNQTVKIELQPVDLCHSRCHKEIIFAQFSESRCINCYGVLVGKGADIEEVSGSSAILCAISSFREVSGHRKQILTHPQSILFSLFSFRIAVGVEQFSIHGD